MNKLPLLLTTLTITIFFCLPLQAQDEHAGFSLKDRMFFGGNVGLELNRAFFVDLSPLVGVQLTNKFSTGLGVTYQYYKQEDYPGISTYGGRAFGRYEIYKPFFLYTEYETLNVVKFDSFDPDGQNFTSRHWIPNLFAGAGVLQRLGGRIGLSVSLLYNFLYNPDNSVYARPYVFRAGFVFLPK